MYSHSRSRYCWAGHEPKKGKHVNLCRCFADGTAADVFANLSSGDRVHLRRHRLRRGQPVAVVVARRESAAVVDIAEHERHRVEHAQTAAWTSCSFAHLPFVSLSFIRAHCADNGTHVILKICQDTQ